MDRSESKLISSGNFQFITSSTRLHSTPSTIFGMAPADGYIHENYGTANDEVDLYE
jgi:hypothetical protein